MGEGTPMAGLQEQLQTVISKALIDLNKINSPAKSNTPTPILKLQDNLSTAPDLKTLKLRSLFYKNGQYIKDSAEREKFVNDILRHYSNKVINEWIICEISADPYILELLVFSKAFRKIFNENKELRENVELRLRTLRLIKILSPVYDDMFQKIWYNEKFQMAYNPFNIFNDKKRNDDNLKTFREIFNKLVKTLNQTNGKELDTLIGSSLHKLAKALIEIKENFDKFAPQYKTEEFYKNLDKCYKFFTDVPENIPKDQKKIKKWILRFPKKTDLNCNYIVAACSRVFK